MHILGVSAYYHDSASAIIKDGKVLCAVEEERFTRIKHDNQLPLRSIEFCLKQANIKINQLDYLAYYEKPLKKFERILDTFVETYPYSFKTFLKGIPEWLDYKIKVEYSLRKNLGYKGKILFIPHHFSHAAAAYYCSPFNNAAILTVDGVGEYQTTGLYRGDNTKIFPLKNIDFPHSLGLLYSTFTAFLGFKVNEDEYKLMGLAAYGCPKYVEDIYKLINIKEDGSFNLNLKYFSFREDFRMWSSKFEDVFGQPRRPNEIMTTKHKDIAASIQKVTEEIYFKILTHLHSLTKTENLCLSGGVALNALANGKIYQNSPFKHIYIFGAAGDGGTAVGAGLYTYYQVLNKNFRDKQTVNSLALGSSFSDREIQEILKQYPVKFEHFSNSNEITNKTAQLLVENKIVGWFQNKMEFGPRALGSRSILANPQPRKMKEKVNIIKIREQFRPFAGSVLQEKVHELFEVPEKNHLSPFMIFCFQVKENRRQDIAAIVHQDASCRIQTVSKDDGLYYQLIKRFYQATGVPCVLNTSFNLKGEPIVETPQQAVEDFMKTAMDHLVIGKFLVSKVNRRG